MKRSGSTVLALMIILISGFMLYCSTKNLNPIQAAKSLLQGNNPNADKNVNPIMGQRSIWVDPNKPVQ
jgi:hypothetical protein